MRRGGFLNPARLLVITFAGAIALGTALLGFPSATVDGRGLPLIDAFFTATSATCVTGLTVIDIGAELTRFGQLVVLLLIQIGGLGVMTVTTIFAYALRRRVSLRDTMTVGEALGQPRLSAIGRLTRNVFLVTAAVEGVGAAVLAAAFAGDYGLGRSVYLGIFHSISAFCNAGFDLFGRSLIGYVGHVTVNLTVMGLIVVGGLGFVVLEELLGLGRRRLSLHSRVVLTTTAILIVAGTLLILALEAGNPLTLGPLSFGDKVLAAAFQAVTPRTAGFNTVPIGTLFGPTLLLIIILMFVGASPGSTGGGIKTTTAVVLLQSIRSTLRGRPDVEVGRKRLSAEVASKAWVTASLALVLVVVALFLLLATERLPLMDLLFETVSAFGTVGLSTGITPRLSVLGRIIIPLLMFAGRVGPLTLAVALARRRSDATDWRLPEERIIVG